jgi:hypothetical protein
MDAWKIDDASFLIRNPEGLFNYWWAGCLQSDEFCKLADLIVADSLAQHEALAATPPDHKWIDDSMEVGGYGEPFSLDTSYCVPVEK